MGWGVDYTKSIIAIENLILHYRNNSNFKDILNIYKQIVSGALSSKMLQ